MPRGVLFFRTVQCSNGNSQTARPFRARTPAGVREDIARRYDSACLLPALAIALHGIPCRGPGRPACRARAPLRTPRRRRRQVADRPAGCARAWPLGVGGARLCLAASYLARRRSGGSRLVPASSQERGDGRWVCPATWRATDAGQWPVGARRPNCLVGTEGSGIGMARKSPIDLGMAGG